MEAQWNSADNKNIVPIQEQLDNSKLIMTQEEFSFNGLTIHNPVYKIVPIENAEVFGNARMGAYEGINGNLSHANNGEIGIPKTPYSSLYFNVYLIKK